MHVSCRGRNGDSAQRLAAGNTTKLAASLTERQSFDHCSVNTPIKYFMAYVQREGVGSGMISEC